MRNVGLIILAVVGLGGLFVPSHAAATEAEPLAPVIRYTVVPNRLDWPESGPRLRDGTDCLVVPDRASIAVVRDALASTRFVNGGQEWRLVARPVLPGIPPC